MQLPVVTFSATRYTFTHGMRVRREDLKLRLRFKGYSQTSAARQLGVTRESLNRVLNGHRDSDSLLQRIIDLPPSLPPPTSTKP